MAWLGQPCVTWTQRDWMEAGEESGLGVRKTWVLSRDLSSLHFFFCLNEIIIVLM